jgi:hypothetical protein
MMLKFMKCNAINEAKHLRCYREGCGGVERTNFAGKVMTVVAVMAKQDGDNSRGGHYIELRR